VAVAVLDRRLCRIAPIGMRIQAGGARLCLQPAYADASVISGHAAALHPNPSTHAHESAGDQHAGAANGYAGYAGYANCRGGEHSNLARVPGRGLTLALQHRLR
jgi:hypothetical protein